MQTATARTHASFPTTERDFRWLVLELENWGRWARSYTGPDRYQPSICAMFMPDKFWDEAWGEKPPPRRVEPMLRKGDAERMEGHLVMLGYRHMKVLRRAHVFSEWVSLTANDYQAALRALADRIWGYE